MNLSQQSHPIIKFVASRPSISLNQLLRLFQSSFERTITLAEKANGQFSISSIEEVGLKNNIPQITLSPRALFNPLGILPQYIFEVLSEQSASKEDTLYQFLNLFNERIIQLQYAAFQKSRLYLSFELRPNDNAFNTMINAMTGCNHSATSEISPLERLFYANVFNRRHISRSVIEKTLRQIFKLPINIQSNQGQWFNLPKTQQSKLGQHFNQVGRNVALGQRYWNIQHKVMLVIGPLTLAEFTQFLPKKSSLKRLNAWLGLLLPNEIHYELKFILHQDSIPETQLNHHHSALGHTTWLKSKPSQAHCQQYQIKGAPR